MNKELLDMLESFLSLFEMMALSLPDEKLMDVILEKIFELRQQVDSIPPHNPSSPPFVGNPKPYISDIPPYSNWDVYKDYVKNLNKRR